LLSVAVFGRSVTLVMQALRTHDETAFDEWYAPWEAEMRSDPLVLYFNRLRVMVLHYDRRGAIGVVVNSSRESDIGSIHIEDLPEPAIHLGLPITDRSVQRLCRLYRNYLRRMFDEFAPVAWAVQDREWAAEAARSENPPPPV
jgi:hypothetical protein